MRVLIISLRLSYGIYDSLHLSWGKVAGVAAKYREANAKWFAAEQTVNSLSRTMNANKKLLGQGHDAAIMKVIDSNRKGMLRAIDGLE